MVKHNSNTRQVNNYKYNINDSREATERRGVGAKGLLEREAACRDERVCATSEKERVQNTKHNTQQERHRRFVMKVTGSNPSVPLRKLQALLWMPASMCGPLRFCFITDAAGSATGDDSTDRPRGTWSCECVREARTRTTQTTDFSVLRAREARGGRLNPPLIDSERVLRAGREKVKQTQDFQLHLSNFNFSNNFISTSTSTQQLQTRYMRPVVKPLMFKRLQNRECSHAGSPFNNWCEPRTRATSSDVQHSACAQLSSNKANEKERNQTQ